MRVCRTAESLEPDASDGNIHGHARSAAARERCSVPLAFPSELMERLNLNLNSGKLPSLDGIRGVSFLIVFVAHAGLDHVIPGRFGVSIFFLLSGYLITTLLIREHRKTGRISLKLFYARRSLRIFPPLYVVVAATAIYLALTHQ